MSKQQVLTMDGVAKEALSNARFLVELDNGHEVQATISGKMRQRYIKVLAGDRVRVEFRHTTSPPEEYHIGIIRELPAYKMNITLIMFNITNSPCKTS